MSLIRTAFRPLSASRSPLAKTTRTYATATVTSTRTNASAPLLANIEASWDSLPAEERYQVYDQLAELNKKDWKEWTIDEKKAAYYISFGPWGPRKPLHGPNHGLKVTAIAGGTIAASLGVFGLIRAMAPPPPKTMTREYQEETNEYMRTNNINPIYGVASEDYKGKGMVQ
ncbi:cytochrome c oxidase subunit IV-domain-containing protein [Naematelia encephala]|uniref:Cytochrome c oxidase subunit IV-domain-containing protein n=1 Tax=Naematelia encephala TaxID=71784 RepID=A0A1Y2BB67_9TREE|nr:cytochrome c oxidase subunit IV-domain-containing protein [Naematelia encephala]